MSLGGTQQPVRRLYCVLSARSLPYAEHALRSLYANATEALALTLITDDPVDKRALVEALLAIDTTRHPTWRVADKGEADELAADFYRTHDAVRRFREGHPCWRKITDPPLFAPPGDEMVILDPDLYFPNRFDFEPTPSTGIALMWQRPHCLLPHDIVMTAYRAQVPLAHHVDIGVAQTRNTLDLDFLDRLIRTLGGKLFWSALALQMGGGYLDPRIWSCWRSSHWKRIALKLGVRGDTLLGAEPFSRMKCFHGGGVAKWWIPLRVAQGEFDLPGEIVGSHALRPFEPLTLQEYLDSRRLKRWAGRLGYYRIMGGAAE
jgi:hypothetical protein